MAEKKKCFIAMPVAMRPEHESKYSEKEHWGHVLHSLIIPAVKAAGYEPVPPVSVGSSLIHEDIIKSLIDCEMVLADLSSLNPNVMFELGVRTALDKPIALIYDGEDKLPFDTSGINTYRYDHRLRGWEIEEERKSIAKHINDSDASCGGKNPLWRRFGLTLAAESPVDPQASPQVAIIELLRSDINALRAEIFSVKNGTNKPHGIDLFSDSILDLSFVEFTSADDMNTEIDIRVSTLGNVSKMASDLAAKIYEINSLNHGLTFDIKINGLLILRKNSYNSESNIRRRITRVLERLNYSGV